MLSNFPMRIFVLVFSGALVLSGCAKMKSVLPSAPGRNRNPSAVYQPPGSIVTLATEPGRVAKVNPDGRFAVVTFPFGGVPGVDRRLNVYRNGLKVAELKVTGPHRDNNTVADILSGVVQISDEVRQD
jgi:hypothetical protein